MNLYRLRERQKKINLREFPFKCELDNQKKFYDKKIDAIKAEIKSIKNKMGEEYRKTFLTKDVLVEYLAHVISLIFNKNNYPKEKEAIQKSREIMHLLEKYQEEKNQLFIIEKEKLEEQIVQLIEIEDKREKNLIKEGFKKIDLSIKFFNKLKDEFFKPNENKETISELSDKFERLMEENRKLKLDLKMIKIVYEKMKEVYDREMDKNLMLKKYFENPNNNKLFTTRIISDGNRYDVFNKLNSKKKKLNINIINPTYSTSISINKDKKCLSQENWHKKRNIKKKLTSYSNYRNHMNNFKTKNYLSIKTDNDFSSYKQIKRVFSAKTLTNKISKNANKTKEEIYLNDVIDYLKQKNFEKNNIIRKIRLSISDELKTLIWVKNFISKLINELRYDIDDIKYYLSNDKNNKILQAKLNYNEKLLFFCVYFYDNCIKGNKKSIYFINNMRNKNKEEKKKVLKTENK